MGDGLVASDLWIHLQLPVFLMAVSVLAQDINMPIHILQIALHREAVETKIGR